MHGHKHKVVWGGGGEGCNCTQNAQLFTFFLPEVNDSSLSLSLLINLCCFRTSTLKRVQNSLENLGGGGGGEFPQVSTPIQCCTATLRSKQLSAVALLAPHP